MSQQINTFDDITERLDEIISTVRSKETSLERSLDLFDEAIALGSKAVDMVDSFTLSPRETALIDGSAVPDDGAGAEGAVSVDAVPTGAIDEPATPAAPAAADTSASDLRETPSAAV